MEVLLPLQRLLQRPIIGVPLLLLQQRLLLLLLQQQQLLLTAAALAFESTPHLSTRDISGSPSLMPVGPSAGVYTWSKQDAYFASVPKGTQTLNPKP